MKDDRWKVGGPLVPDLDTALARYPHTVVRLDGALKAAVRAFLEREAIDILVVSDHWPQHMLQLTSSGAWVLHRGRAARRALQMRPKVPKLCDASRRLCLPHVYLPPLVTHPLARPQ